MADTRLLTRMQLCLITIYPRLHPICVLTGQFEVQPEIPVRACQIALILVGDAAPAISLGIQGVQINGDGEIDYSPFKIAGSGVGHTSVVMGFR